jgi:hypothetical protein
MRVFHTAECDALTSDDALERLGAGLRELRASVSGEMSFERLEAKLHELFVSAERDVLGEELERLDVNLPQLVLAGRVHHRVLRSAMTYTSAAGPVKVMRTLYRQGSSRSVAPLEGRAGIVGGHFTPRAARQALWAVAHLTPQDAEGLFRELGAMSPSKSSLDRLPKRCSAHWEAHREQFEAQLREGLNVPASAVTVAVSLDGVMTPMKDASRQAKRDATFAAGKHRQGPSGYQETGCATLSFYDAGGERLSSVRMARMPEEKKATLKTMLARELEAVLHQRPDLALVKLADGAKDNWRYLSDTLRAGTEVVDFYHAAEHLKDAFDVAYGENTPQARARFETYRHVLLEDGRGVEKVIRALVYLRDRQPQRKALALAVGYFRRHRARMRYATVREAGLPIGSGVVEAACKTLVTQRLKRSGMRWREAGGQAILTLRSLQQSGRFEDGWQLIAQCYRSDFTMPANVILFPNSAAQQ